MEMPEEANLRHLSEMEALLPDLLDEDEEKRFNVALQIARLGRVVIPRAIELTADSRPRMREMACYILGQVGEPKWSDSALLQRYRDGVPTLLHLLENDPEEGVRDGALAALGHIKDPTTIPALCHAATSDSAELRWTATWALGSFSGEHSEPGTEENYWETEPGKSYRQMAREALLRLMDDEDDEVRDWATFGLHLGGHDSPEVRARFWKALDDPNVDVRGEACVGLAQCQEPGLATRLEELLRSENVHFCYFEAAEILADPALLPAVEFGAENWFRWKPEDETEEDSADRKVRDVLEALRKL